MKGKSTVLAALRLMVLMMAGSLAGRAFAAEPALVRAGWVRGALVLTDEILEATGPYAERIEPYTWVHQERIGRFKDGPRRNDNFVNPRDIDRAIDELREHIEMLGMGELEVRRVPSAEVAEERAVERTEAGRAVIVIGGPKLDPDLYASLAERSDDPEAFVLRVQDGVATILGPTPKAVLNGTYEFLEQIGFRWYMPGDFGRVVPKGRTHVLPEEQLTFHVPSFKRRYRLTFERRWLFQRPHVCEFVYRMRYSDIGRVSTGHGTAGVRTHGKGSTYHEHPEFFALIDGERRPWGQLCVSNPGLLDMVVEHHRERFRENPDDTRLLISPNDGYSYCECDECLALDGPRQASLQHPVPSMTDRYVWFMNQAIDRLVEDFPDIQIKAPMMCYAGTMDPPVRYELDPRAEWHCSMVNIHSCRLHGMGNPNCPDRAYDIWLHGAWSELGVNMTSSGYHWNLACPGFPFMMISRFKDELPIFYYELGARYLSNVGTLLHAKWSNEGPSHYLVSKLAWDVDTDTDALLDEFFVKFYGPAAGPMQEYTMLIDRAIYESDHHTGCSWDLLHIYDESVRRRARSAIERAERLVGLRSGLMGQRLVGADQVTGDNALYALRVEVASKGWRYFEAFADVMANRRRHDFEAAMAAQERLRALASSLENDYEYPMQDPGRWTGWSHYYNAFFGNATEAGYKCLSGGGELIAGLSPVWEFMLEPQGIGERIGLYDPFYTGGNWRTIDTHHSWGTQGLRYYYGEAWYRQRVNIPAAAAGRKVHIWFSGVDLGAKVWVNGQLLDTSPGADFDITSSGGRTGPFEFDATDAIRPGGENLVVVRVIRDNCNELGTGGLRDVAMFYVPGEQDEDPDSEE